MDENDLFMHIDALKTENIKEKYSSKDNKEKCVKKKIQILQKLKSLKKKISNKFF